MDWRSVNFYLVGNIFPDYSLDAQLASFKTYLQTYAAHGVNTISLVWWNPVNIVTGAIDSSFSNPPAALAPKPLSDVQAFTRAAHEMGMKVIWKPHFVTNDSRADNVNPLTVGPNFDASNFLSSVKAFWHTAAGAAQAVGTDLLVLGTEHQNFSVGLYEVAWRSIISDVRSVFSGLLTYDELGVLGRDYAVGADDIKFWDALDFIGMSMYPPLTRGPGPVTYEAAYRTLFNSPANIGDTGPGVSYPSVLAALAEKFGKPVLFTEAGAVSAAGTLQLPSAGIPSTVLNYEEQRIFYKVLLDVFSNYNWVAGINWWSQHNEFSAPTTSPSWINYFNQYVQLGFDFLNKPAAQEVSAYWQGNMLPAPLVMAGTTNPDGTSNRDDQMFGGFLGDTFTGLGGNDTIRGFGGFDVAVFRGPRADYSISSADGVVTVEDSFAGRDGTDALHRVEALRFSDQSVLTAFGLVKTAELGVIRALAPEDTSNSAADRIIRGEHTLPEYVTHLVDLALDRPIPAIVVFDFIMGKTPTAIQLDLLSHFVSTQINSPGYQATSLPRLGGYEAMGLALSETSEFSAQFKAAMDTEFIISTYFDAFGRNPAAAQVSHFQSQIDYFEGLYLGAGIDAETAGLRARGATVGQMLGFAANESGNQYREAAITFLRDASDGSASYSIDLLGTYGLT